MSKAIDISNYEAFVMDYLENNLDSAQRESFRAFLLLHPEIERELEEIASSELEVRPPITKMDTSSLKIEVVPVGPITGDNYEMALALEPQSPQVERFLESNPLFVKEARLYAAVKLQADTSITYPVKGELKKPIPLWDKASPVAWRAAAVIVVLVGIVGLLRDFSANEYSPRESFNAYASLDFPQGIDNHQEGSLNNSAQIAAQTARTSVEEPLNRAPIASLSQNWESPTIQYRDEPMMAVATPSEVIRIKSDRNPQRTPELSVAQFIGKEVFNVNPTKVQTTRALLAESAKQVIERNDQIALDTKQTGDDRKVFRLMAGALEFKRVTYTASN